MTIQSEKFEFRELNMETEVIALNTIANLLQVADEQDYWLLTSEAIKHIKELKRLFYLKPESDLKAA